MTDVQSHDTEDDTMNITQHDEGVGPAQSVETEVEEESTDTGSEDSPPPEAKHKNLLEKISDKAKDIPTSVVLQSTKTEPDELLEQFSEWKAKKDYSPHIMSVVNNLLIAAITQSNKSIIPKRLQKAMETKVITMRASSEKARNTLAKEYKTALSKQGELREKAIQKTVKKVRSFGSEQYSNRVFRALYTHPAYRIVVGKKHWKQIYIWVNEYTRQIVNAKHDLLCKWYIGDDYVFGDSILLPPDYVYVLEEKKSIFSSTVHPIVDIATLGQEFSMLLDARSSQTQSKTELDLKSKLTEWLGEQNVRSKFPQSFKEEVGKHWFPESGKSSAKTKLPEIGKVSSVQSDSEEEEPGEEVPDTNVEAFVNNTGLPKPHEWAEESEMLGAAVGPPKRKQTEEKGEMARKKEKTSKKRSFAPIEEDFEGQGQQVDMRGMSAEDVEEMIKDM
ncbi:hypothetical protein KC356_g1859 [Hortaea werneckii]|nr:hypothetical protein KC356_g1859 [Hortaea werneckii]